MAGMLLYVLWVLPTAATRAPPLPCTDSVVPSLSEEDHKHRFFMLDEIHDASGTTCFEALKNMKAVTDSLGYMPDGPWTQCLEKAVKYESTNKDWRRDRRYQSRTRTPQGPAGQVVELFAERVVEAQIHLEDCLSNIEDSHQQPAAQRIKKLASSLQELMIPARM